MKMERPPMAARGLTTSVKKMAAAAANAAMIRASLAFGLIVFIISEGPWLATCEPNDQLTDGGAPDAPELLNCAAAPPFGEAAGSAARLANRASLARPNRLKIAATVSPDVSQLTSAR